MVSDGWNPWFLVAGIRSCSECEYGGNMTTATNMTNATMSGNMTATSGGSAKTHLEGWD